MIGGSIAAGNMILSFLLCALWGALWGLVPFFLGMFLRKIHLGQLGLLCCTLIALLHISLSVFTALGFALAVFLLKQDLPAPGRPGASQPVPPPPAPGGGAVPSTGMGLTCLNGPLRGQSYRIGQDGILLGRGGDCGVCFPANAKGVSQHHCALRWQQGALMLSDLGSTYGTFLDDGRRLPPNYPTVLAVGSRFYLGAPENLFQIVRA